MSSTRPKRGTTETELEDYGPLRHESDLVKVAQIFAGTGNSSRNFRVVQTNVDGSALAVEINTPR